MADEELRLELPGNILQEIYTLNGCQNGADFLRAIDDRFRDLWGNRVRRDTPPSEINRLERCRWSKDKLYGRLKIKWGSDPDDWDRGKFSQRDLEDLVTGKWIQKGDSTHRRLLNAIVLQDRVLMYGPLVYANPTLRWTPDVVLSSEEVYSFTMTALRDGMRTSGVNDILAEKAREAIADVCSNAVVDRMANLGLAMFETPAGRITPDSGSMRSLPGQAISSQPYRIHDHKTRLASFVYHVALSLVEDELAALDHDRS